jgi:Ni/Fe-hydrogenase subunit HybB-like protein
VFISIFWAFGIHLVTAFLYEGLPARPFWNNPLMGPRFSTYFLAFGLPFDFCSNHTALTIFGKPYSCIKKMAKEVHALEKQ